MAISLLKLQSSQTLIGKENVVWLAISLLKLQSSQTSSEM